MAQDAVKKFSDDAAINGLAFDRHEESSTVEACPTPSTWPPRDVLADRLSSAYIPNWNRVASAIPDFLDRLKAAVDADNQLNGETPMAMKFDTALREYVRQKILEIGPAEIVVGIPCYNSEESIAHVVRTVAEGLDRYYHGRTAVVMVADGGSLDYTREVAQSHRGSQAGPQNRVHLPRRSRQRDLAAGDLRSGGAAPGQGLRGVRFRFAEHHAALGAGPAGAGAGRELRLRQSRTTSATNGTPRSPTTSSAR